MKKETAFKALFAAAALAVFLLSAAGIRAADESMQSSKATLQGEIVTADHSYRAETITVRSNEIGAFPNDTMNIFLELSTKISVCNAKEPFKGLDAGREATVTFHELGGVAVADSVAEQC